MCFYETARIDIKEEDFDIKHKTKSQYNGSYTPKSMISGGWDVGGKNLLKDSILRDMRAWNTGKTGLKQPNGTDTNKPKTNSEHQYKPN